MTEMRILSQFSGGLSEFPIVMMHMKPSANREEIIKKELHELNDLQLKLIFPEQAKLMEF